MQNLGFKPTLWTFVFDINVQLHCLPHYLLIIYFFSVNLTCLGNCIHKLFIYTYVLFWCVCWKVNFFFLVSLPLQKSSIYPGYGLFQNNSQDYYLHLHSLFAHFSPLFYFLWNEWLCCHSVVELPQLHKAFFSVYREDGVRSCSREEVH